MDELMDTLMNDDMSASEASDKIKDILFAKSADKINDIKPDIASHLFGNPPEEVEDESETEEDPTSELEDGESPEEEEDPETSITQTPSIGGAVLTNPG